MNNNEVRDFYKEEAEYEKNTLMIKDIIIKVLNINLRELQEKIKYLDKDNKYIDYIDLLNAVIGKKTNKYYYCHNEEDVKYYNLELGRVYEIDKINIDIKKNNKEEKVLDLKARAMLAQKMLIKTNELKEIFQTNIDKGDGILSTIDNRIITQEDVVDFENLIKYLKIILDETGRLKILVTEKEVYNKKMLEEKYNKKNTLGKWIHNIIYKEKI